MKSSLPIFSISFSLLLAVATPVFATEQGGVLFGSYWTGFVEHWQGVFQRQDGISMAILGLGLVALFIITRGKWQK